MGNTLCSDPNEHEKKKRSKKPPMPREQKSEIEKNGNVDTFEFKLPDDPTEEILFESTLGKENNLSADTKITLQHFRIVRVVGSGAFGKVYLVNRKNLEDVYAMKVYNKMTLFEKNVILNTISEKNILKNMNSQFIVKLHFAFQASQKLYLMMDFCVGGELYYHLKKAKKFDENRTRFYIAQVILAIECLHKNDIMYRDLKLENILLGADGYLKLTDFGLSKEGIKGEDLTNTLCGTAEYMSPEQIMNEGHNKMADFWQIGVLTYEMLYGVTPFFNEFRPNKDEIFLDILKAKFSFPAFFSDSARSFIRALLVKDVKVRLGVNGFDEIKQHPFFAEFSWEALEAKELEPPFKPPVRSTFDLQNFNPKLIRNTMTDLAAKDDQPKLRQDIDQQFRGFTFIEDEEVTPQEGLTTTERVTDVEMRKE